MVSENQLLAIPHQTSESSAICFQKPELRFGDQNGRRSGATGIIASSFVVERSRQHLPVALRRISRPAFPTRHLMKSLLSIKDLANLFQSDLGHLPFRSAGR